MPTDLIDPASPTDDIDPLSIEIEPPDPFADPDVQRDGALFLDLKRRTAETMVANSVEMGKILIRHRDKMVRRNAWYEWLTEHLQVSPTGGKDLAQLARYALADPAQFVLNQEAGYSKMVFLAWLDPETRQRLLDDLEAQGLTLLGTGRDTLRRMVRAYTGGDRPDTVLSDTLRLSRRMGSALAEMEGLTLSLLSDPDGREEFKERLEDFITRLQALAGGL